MERTGTIEVHNLPEYALEYEWWVTTAFDSRLWFFGAYSTKERATEVASEIHDGFVIRNEEFDK